MNSHPVVLIGARTFLSASTNSPTDGGQKCPRSRPSHAVSWQVPEAAEPPAAKARCALHVWNILLIILMGPAGTAIGQQVGLKQGTAFTLAGQKALLTQLDTLPFVESEYTKRFRFDCFDNPKLQELRARYKLDQVVASGKDEFDRQVLLMDWAHQQFTRFGRPTAPVKGALEILRGIQEGKPFFCTQYAELLVSAAASLGWVDRVLALRRHQGVAQGGSSEHSTTEIWSNQYRKWVMLDPTSNMYLEKDGVPLNAYEIRQEWFYHAGKDLLFVIGKDRKKYRKSDLPIFLKRFPGFGDLAISPESNYFTSALIGSGKSNTESGTLLISTVSIVITCCMPAIFWLIRVGTLTPSNSL